MGSPISEKAQLQSTAITPFSVLVKKLQDLLSRTEHFEVLTVSHNSLENTRSNAAYMLAKQLRLKLVADEGSDIPGPYRNIMVSIHAIATFKSLDDFLHPRISLSERPKVSRNRDSLLSQIASAARIREQLTSGSDTLGGGGDVSGGQGRPSASSSSARKHGGGSGGVGGRGSSRTRPSSSRDRPSLGTSGKKPGRNHQRARAGNEGNAAEEPLECADEKNLSEEDDDADDHGGPPEDDKEQLDAIVDDLEEYMENRNSRDPTAVNMEVASTGKVTARQEDGTRISAPSNSTTPPSRSAPAHPGSSSAGGGGSGSLATSGRPFSYAAATASSSPAQDWHIEFSVDGKPITSETTVYRAVHHDRPQREEDRPGRDVWSSIHTVKFRRVPGPPPADASTSGSPSALDDDEIDMPLSLRKESATASILRLLKVLHGMNATIDDILAENGSLVGITPEPLAQFINTKLTAKLNRQLEEPLIVASNCLPSWSEDLARLFPFLFPFETRHLFLQSTFFGYSRAMMRWQGTQDDNHHDQYRDDRPFLGRLQRQKVRISRTRILESAIKVMELYGSSPSILEVEYFEEVGTGLGPTLEFYSTVSREFSKKKLKIWRENSFDSSNNEFAFGKRGLFPAPMSDEQATQDQGKKQLQLFRVLGKFVARSMLDSRIIDVSFNPTFFRVAEGGSTSVTPSLGTVKSVDEGLANSLLLLQRFSNARKAIEEDKSVVSGKRSTAIRDIEVDGVRVEDLSLDFTLPGFPSIELIPNGSDVPVTIDNVDTYVDRVVDMTLGSGVRRQVEAFRKGFSQVFSYKALRAFTPNELVMLFGRVEEDWSIESEFTLYICIYFRTGLTWLKLSWTPSKRIMGSTWIVAACETCSKL